MRKETNGQCAIIMLILAAAIVPAVHADDIEVQPGPTALTDALRRAQPGDVILLGAGRYEESVEVPAQITLQGSSVDEVVIFSQEFSCVRVTGPHVVIRNIEFRGTDDTRRGVSSDYAVRIEKCRFVGLPEAVALSRAPLSDVIHCEFIRCEIGVRAIAQASPTIWGCLFEGGGRGVFALNGGPYIRNNLFHNLETGMLLVSDNVHTMIVRNNIFSRCTKAAIEVNGGDFPFAFASIRNNIFHECGAAARGSAALLGGISHCVADNCGETPMSLTDEGVFDYVKQQVSQEAIGLEIHENGTIEIAARQVLRGRGIRQAAESEGTTNAIGFSSDFERPGCRIKPNTTLPKMRFGNDPLIANAVSEEYLYLMMLGLRSQGQGLTTKDGRSMDTHTVQGDGKTVEIVFDISRFFGEHAGMKP